MSCGRTRPRLCMVLHGTYPLGEARVTREARAARAAGYEVDVVALRGPGDPRRDTVEGARVLRLPFSHRRGSGLVRAVYEYLGFTAAAGIVLAFRSLRRRYDVVQVHNPPDFLVASALGPRLRGARIVLDVHDLASDLFEMRFEGRRGLGLALRLLRWIERLAARVADAVVTVHEPYRSELARRGVDAAKVTVVMNSVDEELLPERPRRRAAGKRFRIVHHGTVTPHYGLDVAVGALGLLLAEVPNACLEVYGAGDGLAAAEAEAARLGIEDHVFFSGRYEPQRTVLRRVATASVGLVANLAIARNALVLPAKLLEYVALGVPAVVSDLPTIRTHFADHELTFFRPGSAEALARALASVAVRPDVARKRAAAARARYQAYRWDGQSRAYRTLLDGLLTGAPESTA